MVGFTRKEILDKLREKISRQEPIIGAGAGVGLSAKGAEAGGADFIIIYNSGRYRMAGFESLAGLMPYGDVHEVLLNIGKEVLSVVKKLLWVSARYSSPVSRRVYEKVHKNFKG